MAKNYDISDSSEILQTSEPIALLLKAAPGLNTVSSAITKNQLSSFDKMKLIHAGITKKDLEVLKLKSALDYTTLANALSVTRATLINKKKNEKFGLTLSEKILDIADLYAFGFEVFEDESKFRDWMNAPVRALDYQKPLDLIDNQFGREEVRNIIGRIAYGVYS